jgi:hypothetical protein
VPAATEDDARSFSVRAGSKPGRLGHVCTAVGVVCAKLPTNPVVKRLAICIFRRPSRACKEFYPVSG